MNIPEHWQLHCAPGAEFEISLPPTWKSSAQGDSLLVTPGTCSGYLTILAKSLTDQPTQHDIREIVQGLFPQRRNVSWTASPEGSIWIAARQGEAVLRRSKQWWQRWFARSEWQRWILWVAKTGDTLFLALYLPKQQRDPEEESLARFVLGTLQPKIAPLRTPREFLRGVLELLRKNYPESKVASGSEMSVVLGNAVVNLEQAWKEYQQAPERFEEIALSRARLASAAERAIALPTELAWETNRSRVMPMLLPEDEVRQWHPGLVCSDWIAGLKIAYVLDEPESYRYINLPLFQRWGISLERIHQQALENLEGYFESRPMEIAASQNLDATQVLLPVRADAYNTSRLLSESFQKTLREYLGREYAVGIPSRDLFVAMRIDQFPLVSEIREKIMEDFPTREFPLSRRMLLVSPDGISELTDLDTSGNS